MANNISAVHPMASLLVILQQLRLVKHFRAHIARIRLAQNAVRRSLVPFQIRIVRVRLFAADITFVRFLLGVHAHVQP